MSLHVTHLGCRGEVLKEYDLEDKMTEAPKRRLRRLLLISVPEEYGTVPASEIKNLDSACSKKARALPLIQSGVIADNQVFPDDAEFLRVEYDIYRGEWMFLFEHETFPEHEPLAWLPIWAWSPKEESAE